MSGEWLSGPIRCEGDVVYDGINLDQSLLPLREQLAFRAILLFNSWQTYLCDGRQMDADDMERMLEFIDRFWDESQNEDALRKMIDEFGEFLPGWVFDKKHIVPERALIWTRDEVGRRATRA